MAAGAAGTTVAGGSFTGFCAVVGTSPTVVARSGGTISTWASEEAGAVADEAAGACAAGLAAAVAAGACAEAASGNQQAAASITLAPHPRNRENCGHPCPVMRARASVGIIYSIF